VKNVVEIARRSTDSESGDRNSHNTCDQQVSTEKIVNIDANNTLTSDCGKASFDKTNPEEKGKNNEAVQEIDKNEKEDDVISINEEENLKYMIKSEKSNEHEIAQSANMMSIENERGVKVNITPNSDEGQISED
ncbi:16145_t:CDS:2, partial [Racocetra fulgida]